MEDGRRGGALTPLWAGSEYELAGHDLRQWRGKSVCFWPGLSMNWLA